MSNNNNNVPDVKKDWKIYISLFLYALLGLAIGYAVAKAYLYISDRQTAKKEVLEIKDNEEEVSADLSDFTGEVSSQFEGKNPATVNFKNAAGLKVTQGTGAKAKYFYITTATGTTNLATVYMSYEGGRGYSALDYISEVIAKAIPSVSAPSTVNYKGTSWQYTSTAGTEWHIAPAKNSEWLVVIENKKSNHDALTSVYETLNVK